MKTYGGAEEHSLSPQSLYAHLLAHRRLDIGHSQSSSAGKDKHSYPCQGSSSDCPVYGQSLHQIIIIIIIIIPSSLSIAN